jgi:hypothetical protein
VRVFLCGIIQGSIAEFAVHEQSYRRRVGDIVRRHLPEAEIYCPVSLHPKSLHYDDAKAFRVFEESVEAARRSDLLVAYLPEASMGSAIEMWEARRAGVKVVAISSMEHNWVVKYTADLVVKSIEEFDQAFKDGRINHLLG